VQAGLADFDLSLDHAAEQDHRHCDGHAKPHDSELSRNPDGTERPHCISPFL